MARGESLVRQWHLLLTLQNNRCGLCLDDLEARLEHSRRQIQRDLAVLRDVGFPIEFEERDFGKRYWRLAPNFIEREQLSITLTEQLCLYLSRQLLAPLTGTQFADGVFRLLERIKSLLPPSALEYFADLDETLLVKSVGLQDYSACSRQVAQLQDAIAARQVVLIEYHSSSRQREDELRLQPYGLVLYGTNLYCVGRVAGETAPRVLKVSRIARIAPAGETFTRPADFDLRDYLQGSFGVFAPGRTRRVTVHLADWAAVSVREQCWHPSQTILREENNGVVVRFELADTNEFRRWLLGFGRHARLLEPAELVAEVAEELRTAATAYDG